VSAHAKNANIAKEKPERQTLPKIHAMYCSIIKRSFYDVENAAKPSFGIDQVSASAPFTATTKSSPPYHSNDDFVPGGNAKSNNLRTWSSAVFVVVLICVSRLDNIRFAIVPKNRLDNVKLVNMAQIKSAPPECRQWKVRWNSLRMVGRRCGWDDFWLFRFMINMNIVLVICIQSAWIVNLSVWYCSCSTVNEFYQQCDRSLLNHSSKPLCLALRISRIPIRALLHSVDSIFCVIDFWIRLKYPFVPCFRTLGVRYLTIPYRTTNAIQQFYSWSAHISGWRQIFHLCYLDT